MFLNDFNIRLSEIETDLHKIGTNNIRGIIKDIAELVIQEEKKEVTAVVDTLKGSQLRHIQLVDSLKDKLQEMNERLTLDMDKKIEKKDLATTKNQLRHRLMELEAKLKGRSLAASPSAESLLPSAIYNSKCFFCNQPLNLGEEAIGAFRNHCVPKRFCTLRMNRSKRTGAGFSHILGALNDHLEIDAVQIRSPNDTLSQFKGIHSPHSTRRADSEVPSHVKLAPIIKK
eukprot:TRINITY_DN59556_c0_g1_i2.p1 TRINITY_DN59556_c0_g1~~TRINITY_DN59556_c0_g1_i2.p1  ORF type:complete len:245 (+),score=10.63 TRINITY_DN59556_c0_g1_i2:50-736(+)